MLKFGALFLTLITLFTLTLNPTKGVLLLIALKPIIDTSWDKAFLGTNCLRIIGVSVPIIIIFRIIFSNDGRLFDMPLTIPWILYAFVNFISFVMIMSFGRGIRSLDFFFRSINGFVGFYMFQNYFNEISKFHRLLVAYLIGGIFPMLTGIYGAVTGKVWHMRKAAGLIRNVGLYHDSVCFRHLSYMTIGAILLYWGIFVNKINKKKLVKLSLFAYAMACCVVIFKVYSKAGYLIFALWVLIWTFMKKKFGFLLIIILAIFAINFLTNNKIFREVGMTFSKETGIIEGTEDSKYLLSGRLGTWEEYLKHWMSLDFFYKLFGSGDNVSAHNDYVRALLSSGILGLVIYIIVLVAMGWNILKKLIYQQTDINIIAFMVFVMWIVDSIGLVPSMFPAYQWFTLGFIGLALRGIDGLTKNPNEAQLLDQDL